MSALSTLAFDQPADVELRGKTIKPGDNLLLAYPSANRDEDAFECPFAFVADRTPNRHVGFGFGLHACLGMYLAKVEMIAFMRELLSRVDGIELAATQQSTLEDREEQPIPG